ncbi:MAG: dienelactone hydrolase family protein [Acidimicrobiales bacterium]
MDYVKEYLATEVALDHVDGQVTRREALRRLGMMGISLTAGSALLAACASDGEDQVVAPGQASSTTAPVATTAAGPTTTRPATTPVPSQDVTFAGPRGTLLGVYAAAASPKGGVVVIHENRGLTDGTKAVVARLAGDGYSALAVDLVSGLDPGGTPAVPAADVGSLLSNADVSDRRDDVKASFDELARRNAGRKLALTGFCFGGTVTWDYLTTGDARLAAAAPFYGGTVEGASFSATAAVLGIYGETDTRINATRDAAKANLVRVGAPHELKTYAGVGHGFYSQVDSPQSNQAYADVLNWFDRYLR